jgi:hypothetical protein
MVKSLKEKNIDVFQALSHLENIFSSVCQENPKPFEEKKFQTLFEKIPFSEELLTLAGFEKKENFFVLSETIPRFVLNTFLDSIREQVTILFLKIQDI